jgi:hypothetical protein
MSSRCFHSQLATLLMISTFLNVGAMTVPPIVSATGSYFDVGSAVGTAMAALIQTRWSRSQAAWEYLVSSQEALQLNRSMYHSTQQTFPELLDELHGVAQGCGLDFAQVFFLNTMTEIESLQQELVDVSRPQRPPHLLGHCTDVFSAGDAALLHPAVWGHNEDSGPNDCNLTYIVNATIIDADDPKIVLERFIAYTYPASVAGRAFGWNHHGLILTTNAIFAKINAFDNPAAVPRAFHNRAMYRASSPHEAALLASAVPSVTAFSLNVGTWNLPSTCHIGGGAWASTHCTPAQYHNVEVDPRGGYSFTPIFPRPSSSNWAPSSLASTPHHFYHANNYLVLIGNATNDTCSTARINTLNTYPIPTSLTDVRQMLGDTTTNTSWPVWQHGGLSGLYTMATAVFDFSNGAVELFASNPMTSTSPSLTLPKL